MIDWQQRVVDEKKELDIKIERLDAFSRNVSKSSGTNVFQGLPEKEQCLLWKQWTVMQQYSNILGERIESFEGAAEG